MIIDVNGYRGEAALTREGDYGTLAHYGTTVSFTPGKVYLLEDSKFIVVSNEMSQYVPRVVLTKLKKVN